MFSPARVRSVPNYCSENWCGLRKGIDGSEFPVGSFLAEENSKGKRTRSRIPKRRFPVTRSLFSKLILTAWWNYPIWSRPTSRRHTSETRPL